MGCNARTDAGNSEFRAWYLAVAAWMIPRALTRHNVPWILEHRRSRHEGSTAAQHGRLSRQAVLKFTLIPAACLRPDHYELNHQAVGSSKCRTAVGSVASRPVLAASPGRAAASALRSGGLAEAEARRALGLPLRLLRVERRLRRLSRAEALCSLLLLRVLLRALRRLLGVGSGLRWVRARVRVRVRVRVGVGVRVRVRVGWPAPPSAPPSQGCRSARRAPLPSRAPPRRESATPRARGGAH